MEEIIQECELVDRDEDEIKVNEFMKDNNTPINRELVRLFDGYQTFNETSNSTISKTYSDGDKRGGLNKKFYDYLDLYNYVYNSIKTPRLKEEFHSEFGKVLDKLVRDEDSNSFEFSYLRGLNLFEGEDEFIFTKYCKGYIIRIYNNENDYYGFIIKKNFVEKKKKDKTRRKETDDDIYIELVPNTFHIEPFIVNTNYKCILDQFYFRYEIDDKKMKDTEEVKTFVSCIINRFNNSKMYKHSSNVFSSIKGRTITVKSLI